MLNESAPASTFGHIQIVAIFNLSIALIVFLISTFYPFQILAIEEKGLTPSILDVSKSFSENFCISIRDGLTVEKAGESAVKKLAKGLLFSPVMNEIISTPKEILTSSLSKNIFDGCANDLEVTKEGLDDYLFQLANKVSSKSSRSFPMIRQSSSN